MCKCLLLILCILFPPLAVLIHSGCDINFCINILFTFLAYIPGMIHAIYILHDVWSVMALPLHVQQLTTSRFNQIIYACFI
ncbi:unnamed protein product, partial [Mesorhabditis belari]|uniref:Plasma membrane proteolipid 3 n=1 Tax=Mesorhabditis belari TaxID=2138241 RepID=A0AAF3J846_9BILA